MTDITEPQTSADKVVTVSNPRPPKDTLLALLVQGVDKYPGDGAIGITLHVNGVIISGLLCSMTSFFEKQAEFIRRTVTPEGEGGGFADIFDWLAKESRSQPPDAQTEGSEDDETETAKDDLPGFIHLRAATVWAPRANGDLPETLWRGRLDHVSGWSIGTFGHESPSTHA